MLNCTEIDAGAASAIALVGETDAGAAGALLVLCATSALLVTHGERIVRPVSAVVGAGGGVAATYLLVDAGVACELRLGAAAVSGIVLAALALCVLKTGLFLLGAAGFAAVGHLVYETLPLGGVDAPFVFLDRSGWYWATLGGCAVVGGAVSFAQKTNFVRLVSAALGGCGLAAALHLAVAHFSDAEAPQVALLGVAAAATACGAYVQRRLARRRERAKDGSGRRQRRHDSELAV